MRNELLEKQLDACMHIFWRYGYFNAPIEALVQASGLNRAAIYRCFGGKDGLFLAMLDHYENTVTSVLFAPLLDLENHSNKLQNFFQQLLRCTQEPALRHGCFLIATASDLPVHQPAIQIKIKRFISRFEKLLEHAVRDAMPKSEDNAIIKRKVDFLISNVFGLFTLLRATQDKTRIKNHLKILQQIL